ncbi:hypothetical protein LC612_36230 [Nostoc sp. CHAB 5834]|nr:hypothetical protein [Nostoc sp. CHAB 5834]
MGTRGLIGWRSKGEDKVAYSHMDSYPTQLGARLIAFIRETDINALKTLAVAPMTVVDADAEVPLADYQVVAPLLDSPPAWSSELTWMGLLPGGTLEPWVAGLPYWANYEGFQYSSSCEWVYLVNLDDEVLEIYTSRWRKSRTEGYRSLRVHKPRGRYATDESEEFGVLLVDEIPLAQLKGVSPFAIKGYCEQLYLQYK